MITLAQNYLFCAEKARLGTLAFLLGLAINLVLNVLLLPRFGLIGAIMATAAGNAAALALILYFSGRHGLQLDRSVALCCILPALLIAGPWLALAVVLAAVFFATRHTWLFDHAEREELSQMAGQFADRMQRLTGRSPATTF
jgi:O-antigen/teichoic acid export membrane protein